MSGLLLILALGLCTFLPRYLPLVLWGNRELPDGVKTVLGFVPPAVLAALAFPSMMMPNGVDLDLAWTNPYLVGSIVTLIATMISKRLLLSSSIGIAAFFAVQWLAGG
jgi:branched-subunit amino acid transport protein